MRPELQFPVEYVNAEAERLARTFVPLAIPPRHDLVSSVHGWLFVGDELLLIRDRARGWSLPGGRRRVGETFHRTLERVAWEQAGALIGDARLAGGVTLGREGTTEPTTTPVHEVWFVANVRELVAFSEHFDAEERLLIEPGLARRYLQGWSRLMDEMLAFALAARRPSPVETYGAFDDVAG